VLNYIVSNCACSDVCFGRSRLEDGHPIFSQKRNVLNFKTCMYEGWNFNSGNYLFTTDTK